MLNYPPSSRCVWTPAFRILGGHFDLGSIAFIYLFIYFFAKIRFIETLNRKWNGIPIRHVDSSEGRFSLSNSRNVHLLIIADDSDVFTSILFLLILTKLPRFGGTVLVWTSYMTLNSLAVKSTKTVEGGS